ncbi:GTPase Era [Patescibacteria group bacterium]|nr:GTPase Era [Patescibacteria group bacterium]MBU1922378.1 GTPase Era [Patescibacteria group bacterium]
MTEEQKKSGFVVLVGRSNVGKSMLLNALVGTKVAIITPKPQTTRQAIHGILHDARGQIVFIDTPGIFHKAKDILTKKLNARVREAMREVDALIYVVDPTRAIGPEEREISGLVEMVKKPKILALNKCDINDPAFAQEYKALAKNFDRTIEISAKTGKNLKQLVDAIFEFLPQGEAFYPEHQFTNLENKFWFAELIREKIFIQLRQEVPYSIMVEVEEIKDKNDIFYIKAKIITNADRYKKMIIGKGAQTVKSIGQSARKELEAVTQKKIYLDLEVEVQEHWPEKF